MGISPKTVLHLRTLGHDAIHLSEENLTTLPDADILAKARQEGRILLTHDLDFAELLAVSGESLPSVVIFRLRNMRPEHVNRYLQSVIAEHDEVLVRGAVVSVTEGKLRLRPLPLGPA
jgi:predicted nuclease of predicted toxin-antitoxin system